MITTTAAVTSGAGAIAWDAGELARAQAILTETPTVREAAMRLRERYAPLRVMVIDALDMRGEEPALRAGGRALYLAASDGHCWSVTAQYADAAALIIAEASR